MANENPYLTITLTGRPPVKIKKEDWPIYASADQDWHDGQIEAQANVTMHWAIKVRLHRAQKKAIVYGVFDYSSHWQEEGRPDIRAGHLVEADDVLDLIPQTIEQLAREMEERVSATDDIGHGRPSSGVFPQLAHECIADIPAVEI